MRNRRKPARQCYRLLTGIIELAAMNVEEVCGIRRQQNRSGRPVEVNAYSCIQPSTFPKKEHCSFDIYHSREDHFHHSVKNKERATSGTPPWRAHLWLKPSLNPPEYQECRQHKEYSKVSVTQTMIIPSRSRLSAADGKMTSKMMTSTKRKSSEQNPTDSHLHESSSGSNRTLTNDAHLLEVSPGSNNVTNTIRAES